MEICNKKIKKNCHMYIQHMYIHSTCMHTHMHSHTHTLTCTQDDKIAMDFVVTAANLRAYSFTIPRKSRFDIKCEQWNGRASVLTPSLPPF